jgi:hypothetical protein
MDSTEDELLDVVEKYIENGAPLPSPSDPYWRAVEALGKLRAYPCAHRSIVPIKCEADELWGATLKDIARQRLPSEISDEDREYSDFEGGYRIIVERARAALAKKQA